METQLGRERTPALGGCVQEMEVVNVLFCLPGFLIQPQFIIFPPRFFWSWLNLLCFLFIYLFHGSNLGQRSGGCGVKLDEFGTQTLDVLVCCFGLEDQMETLTHRSSQISERQTDRGNNILTFRWLFLDVRSCQVPVDQRRLTTGQVTHNALGKRGQLMSD